MSHHMSFDVELAVELDSIELAILVHHFQYWISKNKRLGKNDKEKRTWSYQTLEQIAAVFPFWSVQQVERYIKKLVELKILIKGNFNKSPFDRTSWYAFESEERFVKIKKMFSKARNREMEDSESRNPMPEIEGPIPDNITNTRTNNKESTKESSGLPMVGAHSPFLPTKKKKEARIPFGKFVALREGEYEDLSKEMGKTTVDKYIKSIELYVPNRKEGPYKDYAAAIRTWFNRDNPNKGSTINPDVGELPEVLEKKIIQNKAISERIRGIVEPLTGLGKTFAVRNTQVCLTFKQKSIDTGIPYTDDHFTSKLIWNLLQIWPEKQKEIEKICLHVE